MIYATCTTANVALWGLFTDRQTAIDRLETALQSHGEKNPGHMAMTFSRRTPVLGAEPNVVYTQKAPE